MNRRIKRVNVSPNQILWLFSNPKILQEKGMIYWNNYRIKGLPNDAKIVGANFDINDYCIALFIHSEQFPEVPIYEQVPVLEMEAEIIKQEGTYKKVEPYKPLF